jgi:NADPH:quinone reductase-like Zn-dependent oxidoreductase/ubiquinone/menaquinone biosynthesis C-methylase UbiE
VSDPILSPPLCVAVQIALIRLLESWSIRPAAVTSHSSGEIAAAYASGAISLKDAMFILYTRGIYLNALRKKSTAKGAMIAVGLSEESTQSYIDEVDPNGLVVACVNSPASVTVSGNLEAVNALSKKLSEAKIFARKLKVDVAYHSWHLEPLRAQYLEALHSGLRQPGDFRNIRYSSPVSGSIVSNSGDLNSVHWVKNMLQPVLFSEALTALCVEPAKTGSKTSKGVDILVEIGPHSALAGPIRQVLGSSVLKGLDIGYKSALIREKSAVETTQALASFLLARGCKVDLHQVNFPQNPSNLEVLRDLPAYAWNHNIRYWEEPRLNKAHRVRKYPVHDLLGTLVAGENTSAPTWRHIIRPTELPWLHNHLVQSEIIYPGAGYICMAIEGARQIADGVVEGFTLEDVDILEALVVPNAAAGVEVRLYFKPYDQRDPGREGSYDFSVYSITDQENWREHCRGRICCNLAKSDESPSRSNGSRKPGSFVRSIEPSSLYKSLQAVGIYHGPAFQNLLSLSASANQSFGSFVIADIASTMPGQQQASHILHPTTLDSIFQATYSALPDAGNKQNSAMVPKTLKKLFVSSAMLSEPGKQYNFQATLHKYNAQGFEASIFVNDSQESPILIVDKLSCKSLGIAIGVEDTLQTSNKALTIHWADDISANAASVLKDRLLFPPSVSEMAVVANLRRACYYVIHDALQQLDASDIEQLEWHHKAMYQWMLDQEKRAMTNRMGETSYQWRDDPEPVQRELIERAGCESIDGEMAIRVGRALVPIFRRQTAPLELMLEGKLIYSYYKGALRMDRSYQQIKQLMDAFAHKTPRGKILEIGGGTGGCTVHALNELGGGKTDKKLRFAHYTFTDISSGFFEMAKDQFGDWGDLISYTKLDIEKDTANQGFDDGTYDLIIACQVLHATKNMEKTMSNVRRLLKPGGKLMMVETTNDAIDMQIIFGTLPGWWLSEEKERKSSPSLTIDMWDRVLKNTGFSGLDLDVRDSETEAYALSVLMSAAQSTSTKSTDSVVVSFNETMADSSLDGLQRSLSSRMHCRATIEDIQQADPKDKVCVVIDDAPKSILADMDAAQYEKVRGLLLTAGGVLWVSRGATGDCKAPFSSLHTGLLRTLRCENSQVKYISIDLDPSRKAWSQACSAAVTRVFELSFGSSTMEGLDSEYRERQGLLQVPRIQENGQASEAFADTMPIKEKPFFQKTLLRLIAQTPGAIDSLVFEEMPLGGKDVLENYVEIEPAAFGLNFRDVMVALDQLDLSVMGLECSGTITKVGSKATKDFKVGDRICGLLRGHWSNRVTIDCDSIVHMPEGMDFETAASIPLVFATAYYSLIHEARLEEGETVLIHNAAGGVGQAAIMLAKHTGAEIFATAGTPEKREFIRQTFGIPSTHIFSNRDSSFVAKIQKMTNGKGVDVVLNSLAGRLLVDTWKCIGAFGRFVEIGKRDLESNHNLEMEPFTRNVAFYSVDLLLLGERRPRIVAKIMREIMQLIDERKVSPVTPMTVYELPQVVDAFKLMRAGKHLGKIVVRTDKSAFVQVSNLRG